MKKKILSMALAAIALFTVSASAQQTSSPLKQPRGPQTEKCDKADCKKGDKKDCKKADCKKGDKKDGQCKQGFCPFEGLNLTEAQQAKVKAIPTPKAVMKAAKKTDAAKNVDRKAYAKTVRQDYLKEVKSVLTADQYTQFLENMYVNQPAKQMKQGKAGKQMKQGKQGKQDKAPRGDKQGQGKAPRGERPAQQK